MLGRYGTITNPGILNIIRRWYLQNLKIWADFVNSLLSMMTKWKK